MLATLDSTVINILSSLVFSCPNNILNINGYEIEIIFLITPKLKINFIELICKIKMLNNNIKLEINKE